MSRIKIVMLALAAVFALGAVASASASAFVNPILVTPTTHTNISVTSTSKATGNAKLTTVGGGTITCEEESSEGSLATTGSGTARQTKGESKVKFNKCTGPTGKCKTAGAAEGEIKNTVNLLLVWLNKESEKKLGVKVEIPTVTHTLGKGENGKIEFTCGGAPVMVEGAFVAPVKLKTNPGKIITLEAATESSKQDFTKYTVNGAAEATTSLYSNLNSEGWKEAGQSITDVQTESAEVENIES